MRKIILAASLLAAISTAAFAQEPVRFKYAGVEYEYVVADQPDGSRIISGRNLNTSQPFRLTVRGRQVYGTIGYSSVEFSAPRRSLTTGTQVASK